MTEECPYWKCKRDALLAEVDAIERYLMHVEYRTAQLREIGLKVVKRAEKQKIQVDSNSSL